MNTHTLFTTRTSTHFCLSSMSSLVHVMAQLIQTPISENNNSTGMSSMSKEVLFLNQKKCIHEVKEKIPNLDDIYTNHKKMSLAKSLLAKLHSLGSPRQSLPLAQMILELLCLCLISHFRLLFSSGRAGREAHYPITAYSTV